MYQYSLLIRRYGRNLNFSTPEELRKTLSEYFLQSEQQIVERLITFRPAEFKDGMATHSWRDFEVSAYQENID